MENFEYSKMFTAENQDDDNVDRDIADTLEDYLHRHERKMQSDPHFLLPFAPAIFEKAVADCERIAKEFSGSIKAKIDYTHFTATIELCCCYVEFVSSEFMGVLHEISHFAKSVRFTPLLSGNLLIEIEMPYFISAQSLEEVL